MDLQHASDGIHPLIFMMQCLANKERASRDMGRTPRDHLPPILLIHNFMMSFNDPGAQIDNKFQVAMSQIPAPYLPCTLPAKELQPIPISQMRLETHHRGRRVIVRVLTPPDRITAIRAIVADEEGTAVLLQLYHQPDEAVVPADQSLLEDRCYLIKEPFFKSTTSGDSYSLRVDHVSDIVLLDEDDSLLPPRWREPIPTSGPSHNIRMQGNVAVRKESWAEAEQLYTSAIRAATTVQDEQLARLNRSLASLKLGRPASALTDAVSACDGGDAEPTERNLFRKASALYHLAKFDQCLHLLQTLEAAYPSSGATAPLMSRVRARLHEQQTGEYDFRQMHRQARATPPLIDCATYSAPVEVRESPGRGRGLFTTRKVAAGDLLVCEKAFGYAYADDENPGNLKMLMNTSTQTMTMGGQGDLLTQVVQKLYHDPEAARSFVNLYHGDYETVQGCTVDGRPVVDTFLVEKVISLTAFGAPRTTLERTKDLSFLNAAGGASAFQTSGLWSLASHINHSCMSNCRRSFIGDMQIVRATRDLDAGEELLFWYHHPKSFETYDEAQEHLESWGFTCDCTLCLDKQSTHGETLLKRYVLGGDFGEALGGTMNISKAQRIVDQLEKTYSSAAKKPGAVRMEIWDPYFGLGIALLTKNRPKEAIQSIVKGLEALGFIFTSNPPRAGTRGPRAPEQLQIKQWGLVTDSTPQVFLMLFHACEMVSPASAAAAKKYMEVAYTMVVGERETFADTFPGL